MFLSLQDLDPAYVHARFPLISEACRRAGLDLARDPIPVGPAAHYVMGGVLDRSRRPHHGPGSVCGRRGRLHRRPRREPSRQQFTARGTRLRRAGGEGDEGGGRGRAEAGAQRVPVRVAAARGCEGDLARCEARSTLSAIRDLMWRDVGLFRERDSLRRAVGDARGVLAEVDAHIAGGGDLDADGWRAVNLVTVALLIARAAARREESRGAHYRDDYPQRDDIHWKRRVKEVARDS